MQHKLQLKPSDDEALRRGFSHPNQINRMNWKSGRSLGNWFWRPCAVIGIVIWGLFDLNMPSIVEPHPGLKILSGYSDNLGKVFLDNGGEIGPHQLMEAAIADKEYQALSVVD
ncbi:uncharacterized protein Pyn_22268 [Prunus yedoensis var. nudiflora]|uniref:Uncharacterized protein n=1 Tax=Prunus yedoensis var. nudiflora TaxID=2094558 RepID=A0A314ZMD6_PRUYE|nr:uncharacterized protein Pyn_22268 [Prunus yedoensis var. nudiflora]